MNKFINITKNDVDNKETFTLKQVTITYLKYRPKRKS